MKKTQFYLITVVLIFGGLCVAEGQNVGVNTTGSAPDSKHLFEVLQPGTTDNSVGIYVKHSGADATKTLYGFQSIRDGLGLNNIAAYLQALNGTNNYALIVPDGGGNVGIGTTAPLHRLQVGEHDGDANSAQDGVSISDDEGAFLRIRRDATNEFFIEADPGFAGHQLNFRRGSLATTATMTLQGTYVGIGTEDPVTLFELSSSTDPIQMIRNTVEAVNETAMISFNTGANGTAFSDLNRVGSVRTIIKGVSPLKGAMEFRINKGDNTDPAMYIDETTQVGIGTITPNAKLALETAVGGGLILTLADESSDANPKSGNISVNHYTNAEEPLLLISGTSSATNNTVNIGGNIAAANAATDIRFYTAANQTTVTGSERMRIISDGNVGIGTTAPSTMLHVQNGEIKNVSNTFSLHSAISYSSTLGTSPHFIGYKGSGTEASAGHPSVNDLLCGFQGRNVLNPNVNGTGMGIYASENHSASNQGTYITFQTIANGNTAAAEKARILHNGNVGIGTTSPETKLDINGGAFLRSLAAIGRATTTWDTQGYELRLNAQAGTPPLLIESNNTDLMVVNANGNVGVGISAPTYILDVVKANASQVSIRATNEAVSNLGELLFTTSTGNDPNTEVIGSIRGIITQATPSALKGAMGFRVNGGDNTNYAIYIQDDSNVGIGTTTPNAKLQVNGSVNCSGGTCSSDERWKKEIQTLDNVLEKVMQLRGVSYYWRTNEFTDKGFNNRKQIGVIAQEVERVFPELIVTDNEGYKSMDYMSLSAVLLQGMKEQQAIIEELKKDNTILKTTTVSKKEHEVLKAEISEIKAILNQNSKK